MKAYFKRNDLFKELEVVEGFNFLNLLAGMGYDFCLSSLYADIEQARESKCKCNWERGVTCEECKLDYDRFMATNSLLDARIKLSDVVLYRVGFEPDSYFSPSITIDCSLDEESKANPNEEELAKAVVFSQEFISFFSFFALEDDNGNITLLVGKKDELSNIQEELLSVPFSFSTTYPSVANF